MPEIDKDPQLIRLVQMWPGRAMLLICFALINQVQGKSAVVAVFAAACAYTKRYRPILLSLGTLVVLSRDHFLIDNDVIARVIDQEGLAGAISQAVLSGVMVATVLLTCCCLLHFWPRLSTTGPCRRPTFLLAAGLVGLALLAEAPVCRGLTRIALWSFLMTFLPYIWFLAYALGDIKAGERSPPWQRLGLFRPFWGSTLTPFGKALGYLRKFEATTPVELAVTQLKGMKLAIWVGLLSICLRMTSALIHDFMNIPLFDAALAAQIVGAPPPWYMCWASLISFFFEDLLTMTIFGGVIVSAARMAGFRLLRNTYRPLSASNIAEFWNRYYFYYKELLVDHFFYPTFFRFFRANPKTRLFFATFVAACLGNFLYHFLRDIRFVVEMGWYRALVGTQSYALYTFLLALGIGCSQLTSTRNASSRGWWRSRAIPVARIVLFFCLLHVFDAPLDREHSLWQRAGFFLHLFGVNG